MHTKVSSGHALVAFIIATVFPAANPGYGAGVSETEVEKRTQLLREVRVPEGFEATVFAQPPAVNYPVFVSAAPDGTVYISSDRNGSLDRAPHRGRILRARDLDGDGIADDVKQFVPDVDSPRGLVWDHDRLYLLHPPHLSVYIDKDGDGIADEEKVLVKNIAFTFKDRPADHSSNGIELGIDGWIYCAIGDFGFMEAEGTDGRKLQLRGGGVVRVRPDGAGLELYSHGTRNILEVAVSPLLDAFARDNTNDGDGWDVRFHNFAGGSEHGYPSLFKHFKGEFIEPLADYGGGAGCGALFLSEPGFPAGYNNSIYTADWGREWIYKHAITPKGATFTIDQKEFVHVPRPTDLDVDALGHLYVSSWKGATFTYVGEEAGFLARITPKGFKAEPLPDFAHANSAELIGLFESPSHRRTMEAQRELLRRGLNEATVTSLITLSTNESKGIAARVAALFALKQGLHSRAIPILAQLSKNDSMREYAIRALTDRLEELDGVPRDPILAGLKDPNPRVRRESAFAVARLGQDENAAALAPLLGDSDPVVAHTAGQALKSLKDASVAFDIVDHASATAPERTHAFYVLQALHETAVVDGLITRLEQEYQPSRRAGILTALCRLYFTDGQWKGDSWGTRPDTSGPYYQPVAWAETSRIAATLNQFLAKAGPDEAAFLVSELNRHKIQSEETILLVLALAARNEALIPAALEQLAHADSIPNNALPLITKTATDPQASNSARADAVIALSNVGTREAYQTILPALAHLNAEQGERRDFKRAFQAFVRSKNLVQQLEFFETHSKSVESSSALFSEGALVELSERKSSSPEVRGAAKAALDQAWDNPGRRLQILQVVALLERRNWKERVLTATRDEDRLVAEAAVKAAKTLGFGKDLNTAQATAGEPLIGAMKTADVITSVAQQRGSRRAGEQLFTQQGCVNCHTVSADQPLKGPFLGTIATIYKRPELAEAILLPNKTIAQGFTTHHFELKDGSETDGFVIQEAADKVTIRNVTAQEVQIKISDIAKRTKTDKSLMPEGLVANLTLKQFAALLDYLEGLSTR